jgi:arsenite methyltransferase
MIPFFSAAIRAFKIPNLEDQCEDYCQTVTYLGTLSDTPHAFYLDGHYTFSTGKPILICGNTASMPGESRFGRHFSISGNRSIHLGIFPCGPSPIKNPVFDLDNSAGACC